VSRIEAGRTDLRIEPVDLWSAVSEAARLFEDQFAGKEQVLLVDLDPTLPAFWRILNASRRSL